MQVRVVREILSLYIPTGNNIMLGWAIISSKFLKRSPPDSVFLVCTNDEVDEHSWSGGIPCMHQFHVLQLPCGDNTVLRANLHLWTKPGDQDKHTLPGKPSHLRENTLYTPSQKKMNKTLYVCFFCLKIKNLSGITMPYSCFCTAIF